MVKKFKLLKKWRKAYVAQKKYSENGRDIFFRLAASYLPEDRSAFILDIGSGDGKFFEKTGVYKRYRNAISLDANVDTVEKLKQKFGIAEVYRIPENMPYANDSAAFIHCSHVIEHLFPKDLYKFLKEIDRVLAKGGILVISAPMFWDRFYDDLSHIKPYNHEVLLKYLTRNGENYTNKYISKKYEVIKLVFRYRVAKIDDNWSSKYFIVDFLMRIIRRLLSILGFRRYIKNGYTIILKKN